VDKIDPRLQTLIEALAEGELEPDPGDHRRMEIMLELSVPVRQPLPSPPQQPGPSRSVHVA
jgi:hypothetical protein